MTRDTILHAGPPIAWERVSGRMRGAVGGAVVHEGLARPVADAERAASRGDVRFSPCHHHGSVGPMAGIITASMPVFVVENRAHGNHAWSTINEGLGKALRYGANAPDVLDRLVWFRDVLGGALGEAIRRAGGVDVRALIAQALQMGDECHNRNRAASALLVKLLAPEVAALDLPPAERSRILAFAAGNEHFFLNLGMAACKTATDAAHAFRGTPTGIDVRLVLQTSILPQINTGIAHREPGVGQIGAGLVTPPRECFEAALLALAEAASGERR